MPSPLTNPHAGAPWTRLNVNCGTDLFNFLFRGIFTGVNRHTPLVNTLLQAFADELKRNNLSASFDSEPAAVAILGRVNFTNNAEYATAMSNRVLELEQQLRDALAAGRPSLKRRAAPHAPVNPRKPAARRKHVSGGTPTVRGGTPPNGEQPDDAVRQA